MSTFYLQLSTLVLPLFAGVCIAVASKYTRIPTIVLLLVGGVILGPEFLGLVDPDSIDMEIRLMISLSVAVILFEGGLTLHPDGLKKAPKVIWRLLTLGVLTTWLGAAAIIHFMMGFSVSISLAAGSLVIVTGPTVIAPLLKRIHIKDKLFHILHWEGVLIDPIGVFIAILCFEWISIEGTAASHLVQFSLRVLVGVGIGAFGGWALSVLLKKEIIPEKQSNIFVFSTALFLFGISDFIMHESGILTVVVAGLILGWTNPPRLKLIQQFKSDLTDLAIALVFIILAANLELKHFFELGWEVLVIILCLIFLIRPVSIFICSFGTGLNLNEKLFLSWISPRGVVAGSMASLFGYQLVRQGYAEAVFFETFTFSVIAVTIILQGSTAGLVAGWTKVKDKGKRDWLIIGAHLFARKVGEFIHMTSGRNCVFIDTNADAVQDAQQQGYKAVLGNALSADLLPFELSSSIGNILALTDNRDLNHLICEKWSENIDKNNLYRWSSQSPEMERKIGGMGKPVWTVLSKPSKIAYELRNEDVFINHQTITESSRQPMTGSMLLAQNKGQYFFEPPVKPPSGIFDVLLLKRSTQRLIDLIHHQHIMFLELASYRDTLIEVLQKIEELYPDVKCANLSSGLVERESNFPTVLAHGVAAPHLHCSGITDPICFIAKIDKGLEIQTFDGETVKLVFVLISPESNPEMHLRLLAQIAKLTSTPETTQRLMEARTPEDLLMRLA